MSDRIRPRGVYAASWLLSACLAWMRGDEAHAREAVAVATQLAFGATITQKELS